MVLRGEDKSRKGLVGVNVRKKLLMLWIAKHAVKAIFHGIATVMGLHDYTCPTWTRSPQAAAPFYNNHLRGGEGHMEVGKLILNVVKKKATMTLSVKPFGCMPSSGVSDGVQSIITEKHPDAIFCPIETNGDGAVNVYSRVQMMLFKARLAAKEEYKKTLDELGISVDDLRAYLAKGWWRRSSLFYPTHGTVASMAANVAQQFGPQIKKTRVAKILDFGKRVATAPVAAVEAMRGSKAAAH